MNTNLKNVFVLASTICLRYDFSAGQLSNALT